MCVCVCVFCVRLCGTGDMYGPVCDVCGQGKGCDWNYGVCPVNVDALLEQERRLNKTIRDLEVTQVGFPHASSANERTIPKNPPPVVTTAMGDWPYLVPGPDFVACLGFRVWGLGLRMISLILYMVPISWLV